MSSLAGFSQIPVRIKYFVALKEYDPPGPVGFVDPGDAGLSFNGGYPGAVLLEGSIEANYVGFAQGALLKDLGRQITLVDSAGRHTALYREVQVVDGPGSEGVGVAVAPEGPYRTFFVKVWSADGDSVYVVRTG